MSYPIHPFCAMLPDMNDEQFSALCADMQENGQRDAAHLHKGQLIDGRHRQKACALLKVVLRVEDWQPKTSAVESELLSFVVSKNFSRRHLSESQRGYFAAQIAKLKQGNKSSVHANQQTCRFTQEQAATVAQVSTRTVGAARKVIEGGSDALNAAVADGDVSVSDAAKIVGIPKKDQTKAVNAVRAGASKTVAAAAKKITGGTAFNVDEFDGDAPKPVALTFAEKIKKQHHDIESFCRRLSAEFDDNMPSDPWLDESRVSIARDLLRSVTATIRLAKAHDRPCPKCGGNGCKTCKNSGYMPKNDYLMMGGQ